MPSNYTPNYRLNQWVRSDKVLMEDFNADNARVDTALKAEADARSAADQAEAGIRAAAVKALTETLTGHAASINKLGNCRVQILTYTGTGTYGADNPTSVTFSGKPVFFLSFGGNSILLYAKGCTSIFSLYNGGTSFRTAHMPATWSGNTVRWYGETNSMQGSGATTHYVAAFYAEDEK